MEYIYIFEESEFLFCNLNFYFVISHYKTPSRISQKVLQSFHTLSFFPYIHMCTTLIFLFTLWQSGACLTEKSKKKKKIHIYVERHLQYFLVHLSDYQSHYNFMAGYRRKYSGFNKDFLCIVIRYTPVSLCTMISFRDTKFDLIFLLAI